MGFSPLADMRRRIPDVGRSSPRNAQVVGVLIHHNAGVDAYGQATAPGREVSANYWITNAGALLPNVDENRRAWTSGAVGYPGGTAADHRFVTVEVSNDGGPGWSISAAAEAALARLIGDVHRRYGLGPVRRGTARGVAVHRDFVPTECPGPYVMAHLGRIIAAAEQYRTGGTPTKKGLTVLHYARADKHSEIGSGRTLRPGDHIYLNTKDGRAQGATNIVGGVGPYSITPHVYAEGQPGDAVELMLMWQDTKARPVKNSPHYTERLVFDDDGKLQASREFKRAVKAGDAVYVRVRAADDNRGLCRITLLRSDAYLIK